VPGTQDLDEAEKTVPAGHENVYNIPAPHLKNFVQSVVTGV
jgi:hypothetical protein